jgi:hypothetical protein
MNLPKATDFETADEWLIELDRIGKELGAKRLGPLAIGRLISTGQVAEFWNEIERLGDLAAIEGNPTIEEQLRAAYIVLTSH